MFGGGGSWGSGCISFFVFQTFPLIAFLLHNAMRAECGGKITLFWIKMQVFGTKKNVLSRVSTPLI